MKLSIIKDVLMRSVALFLTMALPAIGAGAIASDQASGQTSFSPNTSDNGATASVFGSLEFYIPNYTSANYKSFGTEETSENGSSANYIMGIQAGLWSNTAAITRITATPFSSRVFVEYSSATLYGIKSS